MLKLFKLLKARQLKAPFFNFSILWKMQQIINKVYKYKFTDKKQFVTKLKSKNTFAEIIIIPPFLQESNYKTSYHIDVKGMTKEQRSLNLSHI